MPKVEPFNKYLNEYDKWFEEHHYVYLSELEAVRQFIPVGKKGIEIGIGTGRFSIPFGINEGVEPSLVMRHFTSHKGLKVYDGIAENLPLEDNSYDFVLMVTTICFVDNISKCLNEVYRVLKPGGNLILGFVDKSSHLGKEYEKFKVKNKFYRFATFYSINEIKKYLNDANFGELNIIQTVFGDLHTINEVQMFKEGYGEGGFVVISATKVFNKRIKHITEINETQINEVQKWH